MAETQESSQEDSSEVLGSPVSVEEEDSSSNLANCLSIGTRGGGKRRSSAKFVLIDKKRKCEVADGKFEICGDDLDENEVADSDETTAEDVRFMQEAQEVAKNSGDTAIKVGAVIVNRDTKRIIGRGWNRVPRGCEDQFSWDFVNSKDRGEKHLYIVYAVKTAIFDAIRNNHNLKDSIVYVTLHPSNSCAHFITEMEISEVVYISDKYHDESFMKVSREILKAKGIKCRQYSDASIAKCSQN